MKILFLHLLLWSQMVQASVDNLYGKVSAEFVRAANKRFETFYFNTCLQSKFNSDSLEAQWIKSQNKHIQTLGGFFTDSKTITAPVYSWRVTQKKNHCHSMIVPYFQINEADLKALLTKYKFTTIDIKNVAALEFYFESKSMAVYLKQESGYKKVQRVNNKIESTGLAYTEDFKLIEKDLIRLKDVPDLKKISSFIHAGLNFENISESPVFFVINMYAGFLPGAGDQLVRQVVTDFYFKPRAIGLTKDHEFIVYYP